MISSEIQVGTEYAVTSYGSFQSSRQSIGAQDPRVVFQATVLQAPSRGKVVVSMLGTVREIPTGRFIAVYSDYVTAREQYVASVTRAKNAVVAAAATVRALVPEGTRLPWWAAGEVYRDGSQSTSGTLTIQELAALLQAAHDFAKES